MRVEDIKKIAMYGAEPLVEALPHTLPLKG